MTVQTQPSNLSPAQPGGPLAGLSVVITQAEQQSAEFAQLLRNRGALPLFYPCIDFAPPRNLAALDDATRRAAAGEFDWLVVTSVNTVESLVERLAAIGLAPQALAGLRGVAISPETAQAASEKLGLTVENLPDEYPDEYIAPALARSMAVQPGERIFLPQSALAKPDLAQALTDAGAAVTAVDAYRTVLAEGGDDVPTLLWQGQVDAITFASGSTLRAFRKRLDLMGGNLGMLQDVVVACIGPATAEVAQQYGLRVRVMPEIETVEGLVEALAAYFGADKRRPIAR